MNDERSTNATTQANAESANHDDARPRFIDNRDGNTLERAIREHLRALASEGAMPYSLDIASAFFNLPGYSLLAADFENLPKVRLLLGAEPRPEAERDIPQPGDPDEPEWTQRQVQRRLETLEEGLERDRDLLPFSEEIDANIRRLLDALHADPAKLEVRRYTRQFLHAKAYIFRSRGGGSVVGSSNLTKAGLRGSLELNVGQHEDLIVRKVEEWFDDLWENAEPYDLAAVFDRLMAEYEPFLIYLRVLYELYGEELQQEKEESGEIPLTNFQKHGVWRALRIIKNCGGALIADGVGLGKTHTAGEIIQQYRDRRQRVLLVCPAALRDSTWKDFLDQFQMFVTCVSFEQLANDRQFGGVGDHLGRYQDDFQLVVIDEAHHYRNPDAPQRAGVLRQLLMGRPRDVLFLTATPVNNSLWDLYHLLRYFVRQDAHFAEHGVLSIRERFEEAMAEDPFDLNPDLLYPIVDATTVKRTRKHIKKHYSNDVIKLADGTVQTIRFPKPVASTIKYCLEEAAPGFLAEVEEALAPAGSGRPQLTLARYQPEKYPAGAETATEDASIVGLLRSGMLKRFESSGYAFGKTLGRMVDEHDLFLEQLEQGRVVTKEIFHEISAADDDDTVEELLAEDDHLAPASQFNVEALRADVESDRNLLDRLATRARGIVPDTDPKLAALVEELAKIATEAKDEAMDEAEARDKRKVLVFSFFTDTVRWIERFLLRAVEEDPRLEAFRGRIAAIGGDHAGGAESRDNAVFGFAPKSSGAPEGRDDDRFDILISTDVLAEGMNLQQCRNIINYDLPWNPMRLVQRHGRVDRIGGSHTKVFLRTYFPDDDLERLLDLERRVRVKLARAAASVGVETAPIEHGPEQDLSFAETREEIEKLRRKSPELYEQGGTESAAQTGEEYRQDLRKALEERRDEIVHLPWKAGSGMARGERKGHFFCARVGKRTYLRFVPFGGTEQEIVSELGTCLRMIECTKETARHMPPDLKQTAYSAWQLAQKHIFGAWMHETDPANLQPEVPRVNRKIAQFLRENAAGIEQARLDRGLNAVEAPCSVREQNSLRTIWKRQDLAGTDKANALLKEIEDLGLQPFSAPDPLLPIDLADVYLVCWMAIDAADGADGAG